MLCSPGVITARKAQQKEVNADEAPSICGQKKGINNTSCFCDSKMDSRTFCTNCLQCLPMEFCLLEGFFFSVDGAISIWLGEGAHIARAWKGQCHSLNAYHANSPTVTGFHPAVTGLLGACVHVLFVSCSSPWPQSRVIYLGSARAKGERLSDYGG